MMTMVALHLEYGIRPRDFDALITRKGKDFVYLVDCCRWLVCVDQQACCVIGDTPYVGLTDKDKETRKP